MKLIKTQNFINSINDLIFKDIFHKILRYNPNSWYKPQST